MNKMITMISTTEPSADTFICNALANIIMSTNKSASHFVFFCIGTNQVTGDSLGPLTGSQLKMLNLPHTTVYGTWKNPVHALNLEDIWKNAKKKHHDSCFIAIDASFGPKSHLGNICIENRPIYPGQGVGKSLPPVGDIAITGIVCPDCVMRHKKLENTPISHVQTQANVITSGIFQTLFHLSILRKL